ncbi:PECTIN ACETYLESTERASE 4 [Salix koriyanagi]|uniref:Dol-P-Glc:Glc(2)Man(9)GlcNAc(2)-PP-Dol alpha-1,2-glucosyltransferase n=1 Tax=Salix koriyanagi TaxID=2511006 RepID=A0A9Q0VF36_9ROSI|nr:PECTIN ACETYLESTERASE 4 [Salix koriyanagi]
MRRRKPSSAVDNSKSSMTSTLTYSTSHSLGFLDEIKAICLTSWHMKSKLLFSFSPFLVVLVAFVAFVRWNGSVPKEAHAVSPHFAQLMYFSLVSSLALAPLHFSLDQAVHLFRSFWKKRALGFCQWIVALAAGFISVQSYSIAHAYLLADNRHYTFYLWRKVIQSHWSTKYLLVPLYVYSWFSIFRVLARPKIWVLAYFLATAAVLVPAPLIEFRYYTIPFYLMILHSHTVDTQCLVVIGLGYVRIEMSSVPVPVPGSWTLIPWTPPPLLAEGGRRVRWQTSNPNLRLRGLLLWWRKWGKKDWAIAATGFSIIVFILTYLSRRLPLPLDPAATALTTDNLVGLTLLHNARDRGALCLDGSLPGYHFRKGFGSGSNSWLLHIEGGGWCNTIASCLERKSTALGSSKYMDHQVRFSGILSHQSSQNPDFFNWNKVKIRYCDGASFAGHPQHEFKNGTKLLFRGQLIWEALLDELLAIGLFNAKQALLSGCSAGGLATLIHCDDFRERLPKDATVKCLADAGFFLDEKDVLGNYTMRSFYQDVIQLQGVAKSLQKKCITRMDPYKCLFPQEIIKETRTPIFLVNPAYDFWQIQHILVPDASDPQGYWKRCRMNLRYCNPSQMEILLGFRSSLIKALSDFQQKKEGGLFINSCFSHCQTWMAETWHSSTSPRINGKTIAESVGDWYFNRNMAFLWACKTTDVVDDLIVIVYGEDNTIFGLHRFTLPRTHAHQDNLIVTPLYPISPSL